MCAVAPSPSRQSPHTHRRRSPNTLCANKAEHRFCHQLNQLYSNELTVWPSVRKAVCLRSRLLLADRPRNKRGGSAPARAKPKSTDCGSSSSRWKAQCRKENRLPSSARKWAFRRTKYTSGFGTQTRKSLRIRHWQSRLGAKRQQPPQTKITQKAPRSTGSTAKARL